MATCIKNTYEVKAHLWVIPSHGNFECLGSRDLCNLKHKQPKVLFKILQNDTNSFNIENFSTK